MPELSAETLDRLLAGEVSAEEQRRLARAALDDPELFDRLTAAGVAVTGVHAGMPESSRSPSRGQIAAIAALAAAAAIVLAVVYNARRAGPAPTVASGPVPKSTEPISPAPLIAPPVLLTARLETNTGPAGIFRTEEKPSREPRTSGTISSTADEVVPLDLGALDGLTQGLVVDV